MEVLRGLDVPEGRTDLDVRWFLTLVCAASGPAEYDSRRDGDG